MDASLWEQAEAELAAACNAKGYERVPEHVVLVAEYVRDRAVTAYVDAERAKKGTGGHRGGA